MGKLCLGRVFLGLRFQGSGYFLESKAGFTPTRYNGLTVSFVTEPLQKACVNTFYC